MPEQNGRSARATDSTANRCSSKSLPEPARASASASSWDGSLRRIVPASTREVARPPSTRISISGEAPTSPATWNVQQLG